VGLITVAINSAVSRYLTLNLQRKDYIKANKVFNTAFFALSVLLICLVPLIVIFLSARTCSFWFWCTGGFHSRCANVSIIVLLFNVFSPSLIHRVGLLKCL